MSAKQIKSVIELGISSTNINHRDQVRAMAAMAQELARMRVEAAPPTALTDSSGGTASVATPPVLPAVVVPTPWTMDGVGLVAPKGGFDTAVAAILAAQGELETKAAEIIAIVKSPRTPAGITSTDNNIIEVVTTGLTGVADTTGVDATTGIAQLVKLRNNTAALAAAANYAAVSVGLEPITDNSGGHFTTDATNFVTEDTAATAAAVTTGANSLQEVATETALGVLVDNVATIAAKLNEIIALTNANGGPVVVATHHQHTRMKAADVVF